MRTTDTVVLIVSIADSSSNCVADAGEREVLHLHRRDYDRRAGGAAFFGCHARRTSEHFDVGQEIRERLIEPEIRYGPGDFTVFDKERTVARETCLRNDPRIQRADVPEARNEHTALDRLDHV